ncbi:hypothetical protein CTEN210_13276 [Chaetoceros tenuissimus]|uniref:Ankyrin repeat protein n=1 Tax=Chaetoceros tenuissimus TaxID=426638 RepID=A0AAD3D599_9STRA|nr:hypothetical protein CTEN210_13276 [Chaetoceros tenuissimus]
MNIATFQDNLSFIKDIYSKGEWKDKKCRDEILEALEEANSKILNAFCKSVHNLSDHKPSTKSVEKVVTKFPSTLSSLNEDGRLPIQSAVENDATGLDFVVVLAKEGLKHDVGDENARGGLLTVDPKDENGWNTLQCFSNIDTEDSEHSEEYDVRSVNALKQLQRLGLLKKKDIQQYGLLWCSCRNKGRFEYFTSLDPDALLNTKVDNIPWIHDVVDINHLSLALKEGFRYFGSIGGLLFVKNIEGETLLDSSIEYYGTEPMMTMLHELLLPACNYPILHHIFLKAPQHKDVFIQKFPWAYQLRDHNNRSLHQAILAAGPEMMNNNDFLFAALSDDQIRERDPVTTLYPFAAMATGSNADLEKSFYLLRREPGVLDQRVVQRSSNKRKASRLRRSSRKKRKVELFNAVP